MLIVFTYPKLMSIVEVQCMTVLMSWYLIFELYIFLANLDHFYVDLNSRAMFCNVDLTH